jgi:prephenate dehydrogenase
MTSSTPQPEDRSSGEDPGFNHLSEATVLIIGLGLMGGSLALALKGQVRSILAVDPDPGTRALASSRNVVAEISADPNEVVGRADLIVLAAPVRAILELIAELPTWNAGPAVVMDVGSTKARICDAYASLPPRFDPLGGHPMAGLETSGLAHASAELYRGAPFALTPLERTSPFAKGLGEALVQAVGAQPLWLDPTTHDRWAGATSHLPYLLSSALTLATPREAAELIGPGFGSTTRLAASSPSMMADILATNRGEVLGALARFQRRLDDLEKQLRVAEADSLERTLRQVASYRADMIQG